LVVATGGLLTLERAIPEGYQRTLPLYAGKAATRNIGLDGTG
jgi:hypothetical protein